MNLVAPCRQILTDVGTDLEAPATMGHFHNTPAHGTMDC